jgi:hypothetical protein
MFFSPIKHPARLWCPSILLFNGYRVVFPGFRWPGREGDQSRPSSAEVNEWMEQYFCSPYTPPWRGKRQVPFSAVIPPSIPLSTKLHLQAYRLCIYIWSHTRFVSRLSRIYLFVYLTTLSELHGLRLCELEIWNAFVVPRMYCGRPEKNYENQRASGPIWTKIEAQSVMCTETQY